MGGEEERGYYHDRVELSRGKGPSLLLRSIGLRGCVFLTRLSTELRSGLAPHHGASLYEVLACLHESGKQRRVFGGEVVVEIHWEKV